MNNKNLTIIGIVLAIVVLAGGFYLWSQKSADLTQTKTEKMVNNNQQQNQQGQGEEKQQVKNDKTEKNSQEQEENQKQSGKYFKQLSPEEIQKLKKEKDLVWYEIPELNIKFLVTKDTKKDQKYFFTGLNSSQNVHQGKYILGNVIIYRQSVINFAKYCSVEKDGEPICSDGALGVFSLEKNNQLLQNNEYPLCFEGDTISKLDSDIGLCWTHPQAVSFNSEDEYNRYNELLKKSNKTFGMYLNTIQPIK